MTLLSYTGVIHSQCFNKISCSYSNTLGKKADGSFWLWGSGAAGQLGNSGDLDEYLPAQVNALGSLESIYIGGFSTFTIKSNGTLWGTGYNIYGGLGIGSTVLNTTVFTQVGSSNNWKEVTPSKYFAIALKTDHTLWGWGQNDGYQMGNNVCCSNQLSPIQIGTDTDWKVIGISNARSAFAIKNNGTLWCWGTNISALLGDNLVSSRHVPTQHNLDTDWQDIRVGTFHILALKTNGTLWAWGGGENGETGDGLPSIYNRYIPRQIGTADNWKTMAAGERFSMGIKTDGTLWAWGKNDVGQLGDGSTTDQPFPIQIGTATNWDSVSCGYQHTVALRTDGSLWSWGTNDYGQLGNGTTVAVATPTNVNVTGCVLATEGFTKNSNQLVLSPNPVQQEVSLNYHGNEMVTTVVIYDVAGRVVYSTAAIASKTFSCVLNLSQLQGGSYTVVLKNGSTVIVSKKMIKE